MKPKKLTKSTFNPNAFTYVDLGLPSGRLWATENAPGHYTFNEAVDIFDELLPKATAIMELIEECKCTWNKKKKGLDIIGPNGNSIFLPAAGFTSGSSAVRVNEEEGDYWTRMPYNRTHACYLCFYRGGVLPMSHDKRSYGHSVRTCQEYAELPKSEDYGIDGLYRAVDILQKTLGKVDGYQTDDGILEHKCAISAVKELYEQQHVEWSKEDEKYLNLAINIVASDFGENSPTVSWLKSIKNKMQSQPH